ncbi:MAG TPA: type III restriction endonuclease subunit R, partial [Candidatus Dormibacteraeota bacterium]|nr:type III restriction endonuclease subunit R [Candidatus Dormibacteraeota bacterium]
EPQSVDNTKKAKEAIASLNPLCKLRYSATHREQYNLMYKLDPVDAFEQELVKKIEVLSIHSDADFNDPYIKLINVSNKNGYKATVEMDVQKKNGSVKRERKQVDPNSKNDLYLLSGERDLYQGYVIAGIDCNPGNESIEFESGRLLHVGEIIGGLDDNTLKRYQIRETIRTHLDRELQLVHQGIKVLTLFFIDKVENYRIYPDEGDWEKGKYAIMFEEEYDKLIRQPKYQTLFEEDNYISNQNAADVHDGYFAKDKRGNYKNTRITKTGKVSITKADESTFNLIMKDKERLLSFDTPLRFIFSHSALKEGWDNPNVFQICTLVETQDILTKRQKIGRGLRLPVNQQGERQYDENINVLTVVANESYEDFAASLQTEMENETGIRFGYLEEHAFALITDESNEEIGYETSERIFEYLKEQKYLDKKGKVEEKLKEALVDQTFEVPEEYKTIEKEIENEIRKVIKKLPVFNKKDKVDIKLNKEVLLSPEFEKLWNQIKYKTTYSVEMNTEKLIQESIRQIKKLPRFRARRVFKENAYVDIDRSGVKAESHAMRVEEVMEEKRQLPDVLRYLQEQTNLKRRTLVEILVGCERLDDFETNPQAFMEEVMKIINREKRKLIMDGIKYERIGDHDYYEQTLFEDKELIGYMKANAVEVSNEKSVYNYIQYDSMIEKQFAEKLNNDEDVKLFVKLPSAFKIDTPLGNYNPDWAVLIEKDDVEKLYFVVETKGTTDKDQLRFVEHEKIQCGEKHFEALETQAEYKLASDFQELKEEIY